MAREAQERAREPQLPGLVEETPTLALHGLSQTLVDLETPTARRLKTAKQHMSDGAYAKALELLLKILAENPRHDEARFLAAACKFALGEHEAALERLCGLREGGASPATITRIRSLCRQICDALMPRLYGEIVNYIINGDIAAGISRVQQLIRLDPDSAMYRYLLAMLKIHAGEEDEAKHAIDRAVELGRPDEKPDLLQRQSEIRNRVALLRMAPAANAFKQQRYAQARGLLAELDEETRRTRSWQLFDTFIEQRESGKTNGDLPCSTGEAETLYEFILADELDVARNELNRGSPSRAETAARVAIEAIPEYPYPHFLLASAIYHGLFEKLTTDTRPSLDETVEALHEAEGAAKTATQDPEIQAAPYLAEAIREILEVLEEIKREQEKQKRDAKRFKQLFKEFADTMEQAKKGISSTQDLERLQTRMQNIKRGIPSCRKALRTDWGREQLDQLTEVVVSHLRALDDMKNRIRDVETVNTLVQRYNDKMNSLERSGGFTSVADAHSFLSAMLELKTDCVSAMGRIGAEARKQLDDLTREIDRTLTQLHSIL
jgi:tetratricopeptide (TPR) repeat protein